MFDPYKRRRDEGSELFDRLCDGAQQLGASIIVWHGACPRLDGDVSQGAFIQVMLDLAERCRQHGLTLALENVSWCNLATVRDVLALLPDLESVESIGFTFDPFQSAEADTNPFMLLVAMEGRLRNVHLRDFDEANPKRRALLPGEGSLPWPALIRAIAAAGYDGPLMLEGSLLPDPISRFAPVSTLLDPAIEEITQPGNPCSGSLPPGVLEGIALFNRGEFYECHEVIEHEWHAERGEIRALYQGILQIGVGFHHARGGNFRGAVALLTDGIEKVSRFGTVCRNVNTAKLVDDSTLCLDTILSNGPDGINDFDWTTVPAIELVD